MKKVIIFVANRLHIIALIYVVSIILAATFYHFLEGKEMFDCVWWAIITSLTIGYGDHFPVTVLGKTMTCIFAFFWIFGIIPMLVANIIMHLINDKNEFTDAEQRAMFEKLDRIEGLLKRKRKYLR